MVNPHESYNLRIRDVLTTCLLWLFFFLSARVLSLILQQRTVLSHQCARMKSRGMSGDHTHLFDWLFRIKTWDLIALTSVIFLLSLLSDCISWTYGTVFLRWDWAVIIIDGITSFLVGIAVSLLVTVFIHRSYITFAGSPILQSEWVFASMFFGVTIILISAVLLAVFTIGLQWYLVSLMKSSLACSLLITSLVSSYFFVMPLHQMAEQSSQPQLMDVCVRLAILTALSLIVTTTFEILAAITVAICEECHLSYGYYTLFGPTVLINLVSLWLTIDQSEYEKRMKLVHEWVMRMVFKEESIRLSKKLTLSLNVDATNQSNDGINETNTQSDSVAAVVAVSSPTPTSELP